MNCVVLFLLLICSWSTAWASGSLTVIGVVDGQKFGTNVIGPTSSVTFEGDSPEEAHLLSICDVGTQCRVVVEVKKGDVVTRLLQVSRWKGAAPTKLAPSSATAPSKTPSPSFSCVLARTASERLICREPGLMALDRDLSRAFADCMSRQAAPGQAKLRQEQRVWIRTVRDRCVDELCLSKVYRERIAVLLAP